MKNLIEIEIRGLPKSGKSAIAQIIASALEQHGLVLCSTDEQRDRDVSGVVRFIASKTVISIKTTTSSKKSKEVVDDP